VIAEDRETFVLYVLATLAEKAYTSVARLFRRKSTNIDNIEESGEQGR